MKMIANEFYKGEKKRVIRNVYIVRDLALETRKQMLCYFFRAESSYFTVSFIHYHL